MFSEQLQSSTALFICPPKYPRIVQVTSGAKTRTCRCCVLHNTPPPPFSSVRGREFELLFVSFERHLLDVGGRVGPGLQTFKERKREEKKKNPQCRQGRDNDVYMSAGEVRMRYKLMPLVASSLCVTLVTPLLSVIKQISFVPRVEKGTFRFPAFLPHLRLKVPASFFFF